MNLSQTRFWQTFLLTSSLLLVICSNVLVSDLAASQRDAVFQTLTSKPVTSMGVAENGQLIFTCHQEENAVRVWQVETGKLVHTLSCKAPRCVLDRGGRLYVGSDTQPAVQVFQQDGKWSLVDELETGSAGIYHLSAGRGKEFDGVVIADCILESTPRLKTASYAISVEKDSYQTLKQSLGVSQLDSTGSIVTTQGNFHMFGAATFATYDRNDYLNNQSMDLGKSAERIYRTPAAKQGFWVSDHGIWRGFPPRVVVDDKEVQMVADVNRPLVYGISPGKIAGWKLDDGLPRLKDSRSVKMPAAFQAGDLYGDPKKLRFFQPIALTQGKTLHLFALCSRSNQVFHTHISEFSDNVVSAPEVTSEPVATPGVLFSQQVAPTDSVVKLMAGPAGISISAGKLTWTPTETDIGSHAIKLRISTGGVDSIKRIKIDVFQSQGKEPPLAEPVRLLTEHAFLAPGRKHQSMLLLEGSLLKRLSADAAKVVSSQRLPHACREIFERSDSYVGLGLNAVYVFDKQNLAVKKAIDLSKIGPPRTIACDPIRRITYVSYNDRTYDRVARIDEKTGELKPLKNVAGSWVKMDPQGKHLLTGFKAYMRLGQEPPFNYYDCEDTVGTVRSRSLDMLLKYEIQGASLKLVQARLSAGTNGQRVQLSLDGKRVAYLSHTGAPNNSGNVQVFNVADMTGNGVEFATYNVADCKRFEFHPVLDLAVSPRNGDAVLFNLKTGAVAGEPIKGATASFECMKVSSVRFSADGSRIIFEMQSASLGVLLRSVPFPLDSSQQKTLRKFAVSAASLPDDAGGSSDSNGKQSPEDRGVAKYKYSPADYPLAKLDALKGGRGKAMNTKSVVKWFMNSVVVIKSDEGVGTGFVVGSDGYIMTCAHCLSERGATTVRYRVQNNGKVSVKEATAQVLQVDEDRDMALLKIKSADRLTPIRLSAPRTVTTGEDVCVIGNPGVGLQTLDYTVTEGIVSSSARKLNGHTYIQTSAAVNSGNSGGPVFNDHGLVVGMVVLKARIEGAGFAITPSDLTSFLLRRAVIEKGAPKLDRTWVDASGTYTVKAQLVSAVDQSVELKKDGGGTLKLPLSKLSKGDQEFLKLLSKRMSNNP